jgi:hypothetical protein
MFATLIGTDTGSEAHLHIADELIQLAEKKGFTPGNEELRITPDQIPINKWSLELRGPLDEKAEFLLAVTVPKVPGISPIPVRQTVSGPLFSVIVNSSFIGIWQEGRDFKETKDFECVKKDFLRFLDGIKKQIG